MTMLPSAGDALRYPRYQISRLRKHLVMAALAGIDLVVPSGVTYGFLGPNGAGKTTTIRLLMGFMRPSAGVARMWGHDSWQWRR